jgi:HEAT repeat protein
MFKPIAAIAVLALSSSAHAQTVPQTREYSRMGELSPGTEAPSTQAMVSAIQSGSSEKLKATLEYGERVLCQECVPLLEAKLLASSSPKVREMAAWWLRRQPFAGPAVMRTLTTVLTSDPSAERRARAAEALGEFMDHHALDVLGAASKQDADAGVRAAAVRALARLNTPGAGALITAALADPALAVRSAAVDVVLLVGGFHGFGPLLPLLADADANLRAHVARVVGELRLQDASGALTGLLMSDPSASVRKAAAWALGRIGGAQAVLAAQATKETDPLVLSAIAVAERMR